MHEKGFLQGLDYIGKHSEIMEFIANNSRQCRPRRARWQPFRGCDRAEGRTEIAGARVYNSAMPSGPLFLVHDREHPERSTAGRLALARSLLAAGNWCTPCWRQARAAERRANEARSSLLACAAIHEALSAPAWCEPCSPIVGEALMAVSGSTIEQIAATRPART